MRRRIALAVSSVIAVLAIETAIFLAFVGVPPSIELIVSNFHSGYAFFMIFLGASSSMAIYDLIASFLEKRGYSDFRGFFVAFDASETATKETAADFSQKRVAYPMIICLSVVFMIVITYFQFRTLNDPPLFTYDIFGISGSSAR